MASVEFGGVRLRPMTVEDQKQVLEWRSDPELSKYMYTDIESPSLQNQVRWFESVSRSDNSVYWMIQLDDGIDVGVVNLTQLFPIHGRADWAFYLASPAVRGKGVGSKVETAILHYVFAHLRLQKLCCQVLSSNEPVVQLHKKFGFEVEGILKKHYFRGGQWQDVYCLAMFADEAKKRGYDKTEVLIKA